VTAALSSPETADDVLTWMTLRCDGTGRVTASHRDIAAALGIGRTTAANAIARLLAAHRVVVLRRGTGYRYPTVWCVMS
jgi:hypothetical protein